MAGCPSKFTLALAKTGDLPSSEREMLAEHLDSCATCREAAESMDQNIAAYESSGSKHLARLMARIDEEGSGPTTRYRRLLTPMRIAVFGGITAAAAAMLLFFVFSAAPLPKIGNDEIRFKGNISLEVVAKRDKRQFLVKEGSRLAKNDALRFVVTTATGGYLHLFSVDAAGKVSSFYPESDPSDDPQPMAISGSGRHELPGSVILDDAVGTERFVLVFSKEPFDRAEVQGYMTADEQTASNLDATGKTFRSALDIQILSVRKEKKPAI